MNLTADAEQAKHTGGMIALMPRSEDAVHYAVPGGESVDEMHCTLAYFGEDVGDHDPQEIIEALDDIVSEFGRIDARVFAWALFNPDAYDGREPCAVYLVGNSDDITPLRDSILESVGYLFDLPKQHEPYHAHITAGYGIPLDELSPTGDVVFDRVELHWAGRVVAFPLA